MTGEANEMPLESSGWAARVMAILLRQLPDEERPAQLGGGGGPLSTGALPQADLEQAGIVGRQAGVVGRSDSIFHQSGLATCGNLVTIRHQGKPLRYSFRQALPFEKPLPKRVVGLGAAHECPSGRCLQVTQKLLQQRTVLRAELAVLAEDNGSVLVRGRELKVPMVKQERVRSAAHVCADELEPQDSCWIVENRFAEQSAFFIEVDNLRRFPVQEAVIAQALVE